MSEPTRKEMIWLSCKRKTCCFTPFVMPTGQDIWRISRALQTPPASFLRYFVTPQYRRDAFALDRSERRFRIVLAKGTSRRKSSLPPCIFLLRTRDGDHRCGLGDLRPMVCQAFPSDVEDGVLHLQAKVACSCRPWALSDVDIAEELTVVTARQADAEQYCQIVARWNERMAAQPEDVARSFADYCAYVLESYDRMAVDTVTGSTA